VLAGFHLRQLVLITAGGRWKTGPHPKLTETSRAMGPWAGEIPIGAPGGANGASVMKSSLVALE